MHPFYIVPNIKHYTGKYVEYQWKPHRQERGVDKKQPYFVGGDVKLAPKVSAYPEGVAFEKCEYPLQHINLYFNFYLATALQDICKLNKGLPALYTR